MHSFTAASSSVVADLQSPPSDPELHRTERFTCQPLPSCRTRNCGKQHWDIYTSTLPQHGSAVHVPHVRLLLYCVLPACIQKWSLLTRPGKNPLPGFTYAIDRNAVTWRQSLWTHKNTSKHPECFVIVLLSTSPAPSLDWRFWRPHCYFHHDRSGHQHQWRLHPGMHHKNHIKGA